MNINTGIHTKIDEERRISSAYRHYGNGLFDSWAWETFLWNGDKIEAHYRTCNSANDVIILHERIVLKLEEEL